MRIHLIWCVVGSLCLLPGCKLTPFLRGKDEAALRAEGQAPTREALVNFLSVSSQQVQSLSCKEVDLDVKQGIQPVGLMARMSCQKPRDFRLIGSVTGKTIVDMGSNNGEFWYWISKAEPPYLFYCSYADLNAGNARLPFPFQPEWIMEALGMGTYGPPEQYQLVNKPQSYELVQDITDGQGRKVRKVTVFNKRPSSVQVTDYILKDANDKEICSAHVYDVHRVGNAVVPKKVVLSWPSEKITMTMRLPEIEVNQGVHPDLQATLFSKPKLQDVPTYDLARGPDSPSGIKRAGGLNR